MPIRCDKEIYSVVHEEHMVHNDFFLRYLDFEETALPTALSMACLAEGTECFRVQYGREEIAARLSYSRRELPRYRDSSLMRILGISRRPGTAFLHEHFSFFASRAVDELLVEAACGGELGQGQTSRVGDKESKS